jgi:hypothetical protein
MANRPPRLLLEMLTFKRPYGSNGDEQFIKRFIAPLGATADAFGNYHLRIGTAPVLWSCHTDSVHHTSGRQNVTYGYDNVIRLAGIDKKAALSGKAPNCLGADDAAGVWIMSEMIRAGIEGYYVFHRGEECGGLGSGWMAKNWDFTGISYAIAFDRRGDHSIITHQGGGKCCSDEFAWDFAKSLGDFGYKLEPDPTGLYTDTAEYVDLIPECTNISVGYQFEHGWKECLDANYLVALRDAVIGCKSIGNWVIERACGDDGYTSSTTYGGNWGRHYAKDNDPVQTYTISRNAEPVVYWCNKCNAEYLGLGCKCEPAPWITSTGYEAPSRYLGSHSLSDREFLETQKLDPAWEAAIEADDYRDEKLEKTILRILKGGKK